MIDGPQDVAVAVETVVGSNAGTNGEDGGGGKGAGVGRVQVCLALWIRHPRVEIDLGICGRLALTQTIHHGANGHSTEEGFGIKGSDPFQGAIDSL